MEGILKNLLLLLGALGITILILLAGTAIVVCAKAFINSFKE